MRSRLARFGVILFAVSGAGLGAYATLAPRHYFDHFPGGGHRWVAMDGPYNEHLMRDYGALNLALGVIAVCTLVYWSRPMVVAVSLAEIVYWLLHLEYHLFHLHRFGRAADQVGAVVALLTVPVVGGLLLARARAVAEPSERNRAQP